MYHYTAYGLHIRSVVMLPELGVASSSRGNPDISITRDSLPAPPDFPVEASYYVDPKPGATYLAWKDVGAFLVRDGREIICDPLPESTDKAVRLPLLGVVMGILLHQRGLFTLHASAVAIDGGAIGFVGWKGAGKSTMAATLQERGHPLLTDDILAFDNDDSNNDLRVLPAFPQIKLWPDAATALGYDLDTLPALSPTLEKRTLRSECEFLSRPVPISRIYVLAEGDSLSIDRISGSEAFATLMAQTYAPRFLGSDASTPEHFEQCQDVVQRVPLYHLIRPKDLSALGKVATRIERHCGMDDNTKADRTKADTQARHSEGTA